VSKSDHERAFLTRLRQLAPDLPAPAQEVRFHPRRKWRFDFCWRLPSGGGGVAVEVDGGQWAAGGGRHNRDSDRWKVSEAAALGWVLLRFSGQMIAADPARCIELLRAALQRAGLVEEGPGHLPPAA
jgi:very-short-patch-repair endonuclease